MFRILLLLILSFLSIKDVSGTTWSGSYQNGYMNLAINIDDVAGTADVQLSALQGASGWYGIGIGSSMGNSEMIVMWVNSDGSTTISLRDPSQNQMPSASANQSIITNIATTSSSGAFHFSMPLTTSVYTLSSSTSRFIWAYAPSTPASSSATSSFNRHSAQGLFSLSFSASTTTGNSTATTGVPSATATAINSGGGSFVVEGLSYDTLILVHALMGFCAWGLLAPISVFIARFGRHLHGTWVPAHYLIQVGGVGILTIIGCTLGYFASVGVHLMTLHQIIGLVMFLGVICQIFLGWLIHHLFDANRARRPLRNHLHRWFGGGLLILGLAQIYFGMKDYSISSTIKTIYFFWLAGIVLIFAALTFFSWRRAQQQRIADAEREFRTSREFQTSREARLSRTLSNNDAAAGPGRIRTFVNEDIDMTEGYVRRK